MASLSISSLPLCLALLQRNKTLTLNSDLRFSLRWRSVIVPLLRLPPPPLAALSGESPAIPVADLVERDWSFLEPSGSSDRNGIDRIIATGEVRPDSKVLVAIPTLGFIDRLAESSPCELLVAIHESLMVLATIKEGHDRLRCWQGGIDAVPERFGPFDAVFLCYFPGMGDSIDRILCYLAGRCSEGARLIIGCEQGRHVIEQQHRLQHPDIVTSVLPHRVCLEKAAVDYSFQISEFVDEPTFYLAVLKYCKRTAR